MAASRRQRTPTSTAQAIALVLLGSFALLGTNACAQPSDTKATAKEPGPDAKPDSKALAKPDAKPDAKPKKPDDMPPPAT